LLSLPSKRNAHRPKAPLDHAFHRCIYIDVVDYRLLSTASLPNISKKKCVNLRNGQQALCSQFWLDFLFSSHLSLIWSIPMADVKALSSVPFEASDFLVDLPAETADRITTPELEKILIDTAEVPASSPSVTIGGFSSTVEGSVIPDAIEQQGLGSFNTQLQGQLRSAISPQDPLGFTPRLASQVPSLSTLASFESAAASVAAPTPLFLVGTELDDVLVGSNAADVILGLGGNDIVIALNGTDLVRGGTGDDLIVGGGDRDTLLGEEGNDVIYGDSSDGLTFGNDGNDTIDGGSGNDVIFAGGNNDVVFGGDGTDFLFGGVGDDSINADAGDDIALGEDGNDTVFGGFGNDQLSGNLGDDQVIGGVGNDTVFGNDGNDILIGVDSANAAFGFGKGEIDSMTGGAGKDRFLLAQQGQNFYDDGNPFNTGRGDYGLIKDFEIDGTDKIQLSGKASNYVLREVGGDLPQGVGIFTASKFNFPIDPIDPIDPIGPELMSDSMTGALGAGPAPGENGDAVIFPRPLGGELIGIIGNASTAQLSLTNSNQFEFV
jgi:hypothetical protein